MLTEQQISLALRAVSQIDEQSLLVVSSKLIDDIRAGKYDDGHALTSRISVGDLRVRSEWWNETFYVALIVACASGNLIRLACHAVGVNPALADWKQLLRLSTATTGHEAAVALRLLRVSASMTA